MSKKYTRLTLKERIEISNGVWADESPGQIAKRIGRSISTVSRELKRNVKKKLRSYQAIKAQEKYKENRVTQRSSKKLDKLPDLKSYVHSKLIIEWSPEEIAERLKLEYPEDENMRISHETIYQYLYCLPKGELKKELMKGLRQERKERYSRANRNYSKRSKIADIISISERPKETEDRTIPGHWEGDLIIGKDQKSAIGTLVERTTRLTLIVPLKDRTAFTVRTAFMKAFKSIPVGFKKSLTYDRGLEMSEHKQFTKETKIQVYFADPHSPWQRGTNENTNGLIRQYFRKGTDFRNITPADLKHVEQRLNSRPRKALNYKTPAETFYELITSKTVELGN